MRITASSAPDTFGWILVLSIVPVQETGQPCRFGVPASAQLQEHLFNSLVSRSLCWSRQANAGDQEREILTSLRVQAQRWPAPSGSCAICSSSTPLQARICFRRCGADSGRIVAGIPHLLQIPLSVSLRSDPVGRSLWVCSEYRAADPHQSRDSSR